MSLSDIFLGALGFVFKLLGSILLAILAVMVLVWWIVATLSERRTNAGSNSKGLK